MKRTPINVKIEQLRHAPWNPRATITPESVADLTASIRADGLIQRLAVVEDPDKSLGLDGYAHYIVLAGNRRFVACVQAGLDEIPVEVLDVDIQTAKRMTLIENLQRKDADPLMEAELIKGLTDEGMTVEQIAAETGRGEKWVWRRQQLVNLSDEWRNKVEAELTPFSVDCLEHIARYSKEIQDAAIGHVSFYSYDGVYKWRDFRRTFEDLTRDLSSVEFPRSPCKKCPNNSANAPTLFDVEPQKNGKPAKWGRCLCAECFDRKSAEAVDLKIKTARDLGHKVLNVQHSWNAGYNTRATPDEAHNVLYVWEECGRKCCAYGVAKSAGGTGAAKTEEDKERERQEKARKKVLNAAFDFMSEWIDTSFKNELLEDVSLDEKGERIHVGACIVIAYALSMTPYVVGNYLVSAAVKYNDNSANVHMSIDEVWHLFEAFFEGREKMRVLNLFGLYRDLIKEVMPPELFAAMHGEWRTQSRMQGPWIDDPENEGDESCP